MVCQVELIVNMHFARNRLDLAHSWRHRRCWPPQDTTRSLKRLHCWWTGLPDNDGCRMQLVCGIRDRSCTSLCNMPVAFFPPFIPTPRTHIDQGGYLPARWLAGCIAPYKGTTGVACWAQLGAIFILETLEILGAQCNLERESLAQHLWSVFKRMTRIPYHVQDINLNFWVIDLIVTWWGWGRIHDDNPPSVDAPREKEVVMMLLIDPLCWSSL